MDTAGLNAVRERLLKCRDSAGSFAPQTQEEFQSLIGMLRQTGTVARGALQRLRQIEQDLASDTSASTLASACGVMQQQSQHWSEVTREYDHTHSRLCSIQGRIRSLTAELSAV